MNGWADRTRAALSKPNLTRLISGLFFVLLALVSLTLLTLHDDPLIQTGYLAFPLLMLVSRFARDPRVSRLSGMAALLLVVITGLLIPADFEEIEEAFILIPLLYLIISPHSLWPIGAAVALLLTYFPSMNEQNLLEVFEDALELIVIATFASVMSFYQCKTRRQSRYFREQSLTDDLTRIPNRKACNQQLYRLVNARQHPSGFCFAVLLLDLDDFKRINDQFGHELGDQLLTEVAQRIRAILPEQATAYRIGGDEFCIIITEQDTERLKTRISALLQQLFTAEHSTYPLKHCFKELTPTVGIALYPEDSSEIDLLFRNADLAMYHAKAEGKNRYAYFERPMLEQAIRRYELEEQLKAAIDQHALYLLYQPKVCVRTGQIKGVEVLLRWQSPTLGAISPAEFIPIAEATGFIVPLGLWVLQEACAQLKHWQDQGQRLSIAINISAVQMAQLDFVATVTETIARSGIDGHLLEFELTETAMMIDPDGYIEKFNAFKQLGIQLAIDDFGTAYSSLAYLSQLPVDTLKIDKRFVDQCATRHEDRMIVRTIVQLSQNLGLTTVAEGVEDESQKAVLLAEGADLFQGYLHSQPMRAETLIKWLE